MQWLDAAWTEGELRADREDRGRADRLAQIARGVDGRVGVDGEENEIDAPNGVVVPGPLGADRCCRRSRAFGVARADHDLDSRVDETLRHGLAEAARAADDGDLHAAARRTASARRREASRSVISVCVTTRRTASGPAGSDSSTTRASMRPS